jgi:hypothetical protein
MESMTADQIEAWRKQYRERVEAVARFEAHELAAMTEEQARQKIRALRLFTPWNPEPSQTSGLVQQQSALHGKKHS